MPLLCFVISHNSVNPKCVVSVCVMTALISMSTIDKHMNHSMGHVALPPLPNGQCVIRLIRRLWFRAPDEVCCQDPVVNRRNNHVAHAKFVRAVIPTGRCIVCCHYITNIQCNSFTGFAHRSSFRLVYSCMVLVIISQRHDDPYSIETYMSSLTFSHMPT